MKIFWPIMLLWLGMVLLEATVVPEGEGIMYSDQYCFILTAPKGWVLDSDAARDAEVCAVFYRKGSSWADGDAVFYANTRPKPVKGSVFESVVNADIEDMRKHGSPNSKARLMKELKLKDGRVAQIWEYVGDKWSNVELTALVEEKEGVSAMVLSARSQKALDGAEADFEKLINSYRYAGDADRGAGRVAGQDRCGGGGGFRENR
jgi:hypothetical protein